MINKEKLRQIILIIVASVLVVAVAGLSFYAYQANSKLNTLSQQLQTLNEKVTNLSEKTLDVGDIYNRVEKSVVKIRVLRIDGDEVGGSGFVFDSTGHVVTNNHVVEGGKEFEVTFSDGSILKAELVGGDMYSDLAVIKVTDVIAVAPLALADSSSLKVGDQVVAVGSPFGLEGSITSGIVSQKGRLLPVTGGYSIPNVIQFDAAINKGNSGGPLLNWRGEVVGVTTAIMPSQGMPAFAGVGFAVPSNMITKVIPSLLEKGKYEHPWLGINVTSLNPDIVEEMGLKTSKGLLIVGVLENSPAQEAGLKGRNSELTIDGEKVSAGGDVIIGMDGVDIKNVEGLLSYLSQKSPGDKATLKIIRDGAELNVELTIGVRPLPSSLPSPLTPK